MKIFPLLSLNRCAGFAPIVRFREYCPAHRFTSQPFVRQHWCACARRKPVVGWVEIFYNRSLNGGNGRPRSNRVMKKFSHPPPAAPLTRNLLNATKETVTCLLSWRSLLTVDCIAGSGGDSSVLSCGKYTMPNLRRVLHSARQMHTCRAHVLSQSMRVLCCFLFVFNRGTWGACLQVRGCNRFFSILRWSSVILQLALAGSFSIWTNRMICFVTMRSWAADQAWNSASQCFEKRILKDSCSTFKIFDRTKAVASVMCKFCFIVVYRCFTTYFAVSLKA